MGICLGLQASVGICRDLLVFVGVCGGLWGSVWLHTLRHSAIWLWGLASSPGLQPLAPGKILSRTGRATIRSRSCSYPQDGRTPPLRTLFGALDGFLPPGHCLVGIINLAGEGGIDGVLLAETEVV